MSEKEYLFEYNYGGRTYCITVIAETGDIARDMLARAGAFAVCQGEVQMRVPVPGGGLLLRLWNFFRR